MTDPRVSVIIPAHDLRYFDLLSQTVESARRQSPSPARIVVAIDHNEELYHLASKALSDVTVVRNRLRRGVSGNRNSGALATDTKLLAFLDGDTLAEPGWLAGLLAPFDDPGVVGTGGGIDALWERRPRWVPDEFLWAFGASHTGLPTEPAPVRNVWTANMAVRADAFATVGGFNVDFGKVGERSRPEDTEFCLRVAGATGGHWQYVPKSRIQHIVQIEHSTMGYFLTRCYNEGRGKIAMSRLLPADQGLRMERDYLRRTLPRAVRHGLRDAVTGRDSNGAGRAGAVVLGVLAAGVGAALELAGPRGDRPLGRELVSEGAPA
jgi:GT2 family glycosyltransferase